MSLGTIILIAVIIIIAVGIYLFYLGIYFGAKGNYRRAHRCNATVVDVSEELKMAVGMTKYGRVIRKKYGSYMVSFDTQQGLITKQACCKKRDIKVGDHIEIRYQIDKEGNVNILSEAMLCWLRQMVLGYTGGLILGIILAILKYNGVF